MTLLRRTVTAAALTLVTTFAVSACGDDVPSDADAPTAPQSDDTEETAPPTQEPSATTEPSETPAESAAAQQTVQITIYGDTVTPQAEAVETGVGEPITLQVTSDREGELHVHAVPEQSFAVKPGDQTFELVLDKPGQVDVEEHGSHQLLLRILVK